jgi:enoyl-CoA hydratase/carnithine racemase
VAETYVEAEHGARAPTVSGLVGLIWRAAAGVALDAAVRVATVDGAGLVELRLGLTWGVPL